MKMEAGKFFETLVSYQIITRRNNMKMEAAWPFETLVYLPHFYTASQLQDGGSKVLRNISILLYHYTAIKENVACYIGPRNEIPVSIKASLGGLCSL
jgi:hypothetical protein